MMCMSKNRDLTGQRFEHWTVLYEAPPKISPSGDCAKSWHCRCDCGKESDVRESCLIGGRSKSCGCYKKDYISEKKLKDMTGLRFGRLVVQKRSEESYVSPNGQIQPRWECLCDCGNTITVSASNLRNGHHLSCGCLRSECMAKVGKTNKSYNRCKFFKTYVIIYTNKNEEIYIDRQDYDKVKEYCWWINDYGYVVANNLNGSNIQIHRLITNCPDDLYVDHIGGKQTRNDNRRFNLRFATPSENRINIGLMPTNTSGVSGVSWVVSKQKWVASIGINQKLIALGHYKNFEDAVAARKKAELELFGEWSYEKSQEIYKSGLTAYECDNVECDDMCLDSELGYYVKRGVA